MTAEATSGPQDASKTARNDNADDVICVRDVRKAFGDTKALQGCSFTARRGEVHAIVGENGSGKSTLAKIISGVFPADSGTVELQGGTPSSPAHARTLGVATVFQEVLLAEGMTVFDNLFIGAEGPRTRKGPRAEQLRRVAAVFTELLGEALDPYGLVDDLPLSMRQWVTIARALLSEPRVLILDESTAALDHSGAERLYEAVVRLKAAGMCVLIVTHRIEELTRFADRATVLRNGVDVGTLEGPQITQNRLLEMMTGDTAHFGEGAPTAALPPPVPQGERAPVVRASGVRLRHGAAPFDLDVTDGEIVGVIGLDGQGQAGLIQAVAGIRPAAEGTITVADRQGNELRITRQKDAADAGVAYIPGDRKLEGTFPNLSILENFGMPLFRTQRSGGVIRFGAVQKAFEEQRAALSIRLNRPSAPIGTLSGGNQQKVLIGRALAADPGVVVLNDPTRGVDISAKHSLYDLLRRLSSQGSTVLFLSSEIVEFIGLCHRVAVFRDDSLFTTLQGEQITVDGVLAAMFGQADGIPGKEKELGS